MTVNTAHNGTLSDRLSCVDDVNLEGRYAIFALPQEELKRSGIISVEGRISSSTKYSL